MVYGGLIYGGSPKTVHFRNISENPNLVVHVGDGVEAIIVEGAVAIEKPTEEAATRLADQMFAKYPQYGRLDPKMYMAGVSVAAAPPGARLDDLLGERPRFRFE